MTDSAAFIRPGGTHFAAVASGSSSSYGTSSIYEPFGRLYANFDAVGDPPGVAVAQGMATQVVIGRSSGSLTTSAFWPCISFAGCSGRYSFYEDGATGGDTTTETFIHGFNKGAGQITLHLNFTASAKTSTLKKDAFTYAPGGGPITYCVSELCVGTPLPLEITTTQTIKVSVYKRTTGPSAGPTPTAPGLGALLSSQSYTGSISTTGTKISGSGVFAALTCGQGCITHTDMIVACGPEMLPTVIGNSWSGSSNVSFNIDLPINVTEAIVVVIQRDVNSQSN